MPQHEFEREVEQIAFYDNQCAKEARINSIKRKMGGRKIPETLYIHAKTNPNAKLQRDKYQIALIDFRA